YAAHFPLWWHDPEMLVRADQLSDEAVWRAHAAAKADLCRLVRERLGAEFDPGVPIVGFARRMTGYKRPNLLFANPERLSAVPAQHPFQVVMAGKRQPRGARGQGRDRKKHQEVRPPPEQGADSVLPHHSHAGR